MERRNSLIIDTEIVVTVSVNRLACVSLASFDRSIQNITEFDGHVSPCQFGTVIEVHAETGEIRICQRTEPDRGTVIFKDEAPHTCGSIIVRDLGREPLFTLRC